MKSYDIAGIRENSLINGFDWYSLNCFVKVKCILSECIAKNSAYLYLLFMDENGWFLNEDKPMEHERFLEKITKINFKTIVGNSNNFAKNLKRHIKNRDYIILCSDNINRMGTEAYRKHHHEHFMILKGYDPQTDQFIVIDEDLSKEYYKPVNCTNGVAYFKQRIDTAYLKELCCIDYSNISGFEDIGKNRYACIKAEFDPGCADEIDMEILKVMYRENIEQTLAKLPDFMNRFKNDVIRLKEEHDFIHARYFLDNPEYFKAWIVFPGKANSISRHFFSIYTQNRFFYLKMEESARKSALMSAFAEVIDGYFRIRNTMLKCLITDDKDKYDLNINYLDEIFPKEQSIYNLILENTSIL